MGSDLSNSVPAQLSGGATATWGALTDDDFDSVNSQTRRLIGATRAQYSYEAPKARTKAARHAAAEAARVKHGE